MLATHMKRPPPRMTSSHVALDLPLVLRIVSFWKLLPEDLIGFLAGGFLLEIFRIGLDAFSGTSFPFTGLELEALPNFCISRIPAWDLRYLSSAPRGRASAPFGFCLGMAEGATQPVTRMATTSSR